MRSVAVVLGTRPEAIKCAPVIKALRDDPRFAPVVLSTGQHRQMLDETLQAFGIRPDVDLDVMAPKQTLSQVTHRALDGLSGYLADERVEAVMVHGTTASRSCTLRPGCAAETCTRRSRRRPTAGWSARSPSCTWRRHRVTAQT
jgi:UDP-N-acetylglucosamine 2-epimerase